LAGTPAKGQTFITSGWRQISVYQVGINFIFLFIAGTAVLLVLE